MLPTSPPGPDRERWRRLETICDAALRLDGAERAAYLESACESDASLRRDVEDLLAHERGAARFLEAAPGAVAASLLSDNLNLAGTRLGDYEIEQRLGEGGMGVVYRPSAYSSICEGGEAASASMARRRMANSCTSCGRKTSAISG